MGRKMSVRKTMDDFCSCNGCGATNYASFTSPRKADVIYDVRIGPMVNRLCLDCLDALAKEIAAVRGNMMAGEGV